jgi:hypothetical protein
MRKITKEASEAFKAEINNDSKNYQPLPYDREKIVFSKDNTQVVIYWTKARRQGRDKHTLLKLHGNTIAHNVQYLGSIDKAFNINLCGWGTPTTRERLNGLLETLGFDFRVKQQRGQQIAYGRWYGSNINRSYTLNEDGNQNVFFINEYITGRNVT